MKEFKINNYLTIKLEEGLSNIYVNGEYFEQCKYLLLNIPKESVKDLEKIESIDEAAALLDQSMEGHEFFDIEISPETEFWGHCSNLQVWSENEYDTRLIHSNLAFPLLKELSCAGDPIAKRIFKEEIAKRLISGYPSVVIYLLEEGYFEEFSKEEKEALRHQIVDKSLLIKSFEEFCNFYTSFFSTRFSILKSVHKEIICENISNISFIERGTVIPSNILTDLHFEEKKEIFNLIKPQIMNLEMLKVRFLDLKTFSDFGIDSARKTLRTDVINVLLGKNEDLIQFIIDQNIMKVLNKSDLEMFSDFPECSNLILNYVIDKLKLKNFKFV
ncbi:MAG: hypothetical protein ACFFKA_06585 [Candidatus Thorarchaeota archaeon]